MGFRHVPIADNLSATLPHSAKRRACSASRRSPWDFMAWLSVGLPSASTDENADPVISKLNDFKSDIIRVRHGTGH